MYLICRGEVEVVDDKGEVLATLREGDCFGEVALLLSEPRTATVRAKTLCDLFVLGRAEFTPHSARSSAVRQQHHGYRPRPLQSHGVRGAAH